MIDAGDNYRRPFLLFVLQRTDGKRLAGALIADRVDEGGGKGHDDSMKAPMKLNLVSLHALFSILF